MPEKLYTLLRNRLYTISRIGLGTLLRNIQLTYGRFKSVTRWVKNNLDNSNFDAALAVVYADRVFDLVW